MSMKRGTKPRAIMALLGGDISLEKARNWLRDKIYSGIPATCPCCGRVIRPWKKTMVSTSVASLVNLVNKWIRNGRPSEGLHRDEFRVSLTDTNFGHLHHWRLIEQVPNADTEKRTSGRWRPTELGCRFVFGEILVSKYIVTLDGELIGRDGPEIGVRDALGQRFSYRRLMDLNRCYPVARITEDRFDLYAAE